MRHRLIGLAVAGLAILGLTGCGSSSVGTSPTPNMTAAVPLTLSNFAKVQNGMPLPQVQALLGTDYVVTSSLPGSAAGSEEGVYMWGSPSQAAAGGGQVLITFSQGVVIASSEIGLG